ncbi:MAG: tetratricopeptide repeat protein [Sphaerospermopsis sp. SIO1G2]|nr:tetratricopeptide repeat protein [Sphaerospermopsis sp. SIO1G2]
MTKLKVLIPLLLTIFLVACGASALERAATAVSEGNDTEAVAEYTTAISEGLSPAEQYTALTGRGAAHNRLGNTADALTDYSSALTVTNDDGSPAGDRAAVYRARVDILRGAGQAAEAATELRQWLSLEPQRVDLYVELGQLYAETEDWENMVASMTAALDVSPENATALTLRGTAYLELREYELAIADLKASLNGEVDAAMSDIDRQSNLADAFYELGQALYNLGEPQDALVNFDEALTYAESDTDIARIRAERGFIYSELGEYDAALADFDDAISRDPNMAIVYSYRSYVYADLGEYDAAIADADNAIALGTDLSDSSRSAILHARASALLNNGQYEEAVVSATDSINLEGVDSPDAARTYSMRSRANRFLGDYEEALADADKAIELGAADIGALDGFYYNRSAAYYFLGDYENALADQQASIEVGGATPGNYEYMGDIYSAMSDYQNAIASYQVAIDLDPSDPWLRNYLGDIYYEMEDYVSAEAEYRAAISIDGSYTRFYDNLGFVLRLQDRYDEAVEAYTSQLALDPEDGYAYYGRGISYYFLNMDAEAIADLQAARTYDLGQDFIDVINARLSEMGAE